MTLTTLLAQMLLMGPAAREQRARVVKHDIVFFEEGRFAGWPANNGGWSWGNEIVVGFSLGYYKANPDGHPIDPDRPRGRRQARSLDGGETWTIEEPSNVEEDAQAPPQSAQPVDFSHPDFAACFRGGRFYYSYDRCRTWFGPRDLPTFEDRGWQARTDYLVNGRHDLMAFVTAEKEGGGEGRPCCIRTTDGAKTWQFVGWIGEEPGPQGYSIMPSTLRLSDNALLSIIRRRGLVDGETRYWLEGYLSPDNGSNWYLLAQPTIETYGNPPHMIWLQDGRIALTYGYREQPYGVRARISADQGKTWGEEIILRDDGGCWDLGYPRTFQRPDGKCVAVYYFNDKQRPERYLACTIWDPGMPQQPLRTVARSAHRNQAGPAAPPAGAPPVGGGPCAIWRRYTKPPLVWYNNRCVVSICSRWPDGSPARVVRFRAAAASW